MRILGLWSDITKQKSDESKINEYVSSLEKFDTLTSHELRHPVAKIMAISITKRVAIKSSKNLFLNHLKI